MDEVTDEPLYRDRACGIGIGKPGMVATIRVPSDKDPARRMARPAASANTRREVLTDWLRSWQVPAVVMDMFRACPQVKRGQPTRRKPRT